MRKSLPDPPTVTIVTPAFNQATYLPQTIESVLAQDCAGVEYIVIDDGSSDDTPQVLERYCGRLTALRHENMGQARTLNRGWEMARGRYLGYLSSDDLLTPDALSRLIAVLDADPEVVCVFPDSDLIDSASRVVRRSVCRPFDLDSVVVTQECFIGPGALFRREAFTTVGGWRPDLRLAPDREFWLRLAAHGRFHFLPESLAKYRMHPQATSFRAASDEQSREFVRVLDEFYGRAQVPDRLHKRRGEAYAHAALLLARNALWRGELRVALAHYHEACALHPPFRSLSTRLRLLRQGASKPAKIAYAALRRAR